MEFYLKKKKGFLTDLLERQVTFALHKETYKSDFTSHLITIRKIVFIWLLLWKLDKRNQMQVGLGDTIDHQSKINQKFFLPLYF